MAKEGGRSGTGDGGEDDAGRAGCSTLIVTKGVRVDEEGGW